MGCKAKAPQCGAFAFLGEMEKAVQKEYQYRIGTE